MRFDIMTLFPELVSSVLGESIIGRAQKAGYVSVHTHNIRDFANNKHNKVDDTPYGGGFGMLMMAPPVYDCYTFVKEQAKKELGDNVKSRVIYMSPQGKVLTQNKAQELAGYDNLIILCGHYEGIDSRVIDEIVEGDCLDENVVQIEITIQLDDDDELLENDEIDIYHRECLDDEFDDLEYVECEVDDELIGLTDAIDDEIDALRLIEVVMLKITDDDEVELYLDAHIDEVDTNE